MWKNRNKLRGRRTADWFRSTCDIPQSELEFDPFIKEEYFPPFAQSCKSHFVFLECQKNVWIFHKHTHKPRLEWMSSFHNTELHTGRRSYTLNRTNFTISVLLSVKHTSSTYSVSHRLNVTNKHHHPVEQPSEPACLYSAVSMCDTEQAANTQCQKCTPH